MLVEKARFSVSVPVFSRTHRLSPCFVARCFVAWVVLLAVGCGRERNVSQDRIVRAENVATPRPVRVESVEYYVEKLLDKKFTWTGPTSSEDRIPVLHAARALAYMGDPAVPTLLRASTNEAIDFVSIYDALSRDWSACGRVLERQKWPTTRPRAVEELVGEEPPQDCTRSVEAPPENRLASDF